MLYSIKISIKSAIRNISNYLPTIIFMSIGCTIIYIVLTGYFSFYNEYKEILSKDELEYIRVVPEYMGESKYFLTDGTRNDTNELNEYCVILPEDISYLEENYKDDFTLKVDSWLYTEVYNNQETADNLFSLYMSEGYVREFRERNNIEGDFVICSQNVIDKIQSAKDDNRNNDGEFSLQLKFPLAYDEERDIFIGKSNSQELKIHRIEKLNDIGDIDKEPINYIFGVENENLEKDILENMIIIPINYYYDVYDTKDNLSVININLNPVKNPSKIGDALTDLKIRHNYIYNYSMTDAVYLLLAQIREYVEIFKMLVPALIILMFVVTISFLGIQLIILDRQRRNISIQLMCGATKSKIIIPLLIRSCMITVIGGVIGIFSGIVLTNKLDIVLYKKTVTPTMEAWILTLLFSIILGIIAALPSMNRIHKLEPMEILRS